MIKNDWNEAERREYERHSVMLYLAVYEQGADTALGQIVDISLGGMRLISAQPIDVNVRMHLVIDISLESGRKGKLAIEATSVWAKEDDNPGLYVSGFQFIGLSQDGKDFVQSIINELQ